MGDIEELGRHDPTVASVVSRLARHVDEIKDITVIITWDDGSCDVTGNIKENGEQAWHCALLAKKLMKDID